MPPSFCFKEVTHGLSSDPVSSNDSSTLLGVKADINPHVDAPRVLWDLALVVPRQGGPKKLIQFPPGTTTGHSASPPLPELQSIQSDHRGQVQCIF